MNELLELLKEHGFRQGDFTLASGAKSDFYIDVRTVALSVRGHILLGHQLAVVAITETTLATAVAGVALGGCSLASAVCSCAGIPAIYIRKQTKDHGTAQLVEVPYDVSPGNGVVLLEDVITTGGSALRAIDALENAGYVVKGVVAVVDRCEGGAAAIAERCPVWSLFNRYDFIPEENDES